MAKKLNFSIHFFSKQCFLISNRSTLPTHMQYLTNDRLSCVTFSQDVIVKIIQSLDPGKAHGHDNISIYAIFKPLPIIFKQCIGTGVFPSE